MELEHSLLTRDEDFYKVIAFMFEAILPNGYIEVCWPDGLDEESQKRHAAGFIAHKNMDPTVTWTKVTDKKTGEIVGVAQWLIIKDQKPPEFDFDGPPGTWSNDYEKRYAQEIFRSVTRYRREAIRDNDLSIIVLNIMTVNPKHQHKGVGTMLMEWGTRQADELNALLLVESTSAGRWLYEKSGFTVQHHYPVQASASYERGVVERLFFMTRSRSQ